MLTFNVLYIIIKVQNKTNKKKRKVLCIMKKLIIVVSDSFVRKEIEISVSEKEYNKLMKVYDEEYGLEFKIKEVK